MREDPGSPENRHERLLSMRFIAQFVRATLPRLDRIERPKARVRGKSPRARLREDALSILG